jgi:uncharacterized protein (DUF1800 family)
MSGPAAAATDAGLTRRDLLRASAVAGGAAAALAGGCEDVISGVATRLGQAVPETVGVPATESVDPAHHLVSRAGYGPWPGDVDHVRAVGAAAWIEQQLAPETIDDAACALRARRFETVHLSPGNCYEFKKPVLRSEMSRHTLLRAVYSKRQLFEVMVSFWTDHLNIDIEKGDCIYMKPTDDREVIRRHALGRFRDLILASATSPAMLVYLDGNQNAVSRPGDVPNENYARELLELHTLGVRGGYTQQDVSEAARCLTGWRVRERFRRGTVHFDASRHDDGPKRVLGVDIPAGGGEGDLARVVEIACAHPSTGRHIATKLCQRFVSEDPPAALVERVAGVFRDTDGDVKSMLRAVLNSGEFGASAGAKFKPPFRYVVSALRAVGADTHARDPLVEYLARMGQGVFQHPTPDGYPDEAAPWLGTLLWRWNFAFALAAGKVPTVDVPLAQLTKAIGAEGGADPAAARETIFRYLAGGRPTAPQRQALDEAAAALGSAAAPADLVAVVMASPAFQRY